MKILKKIVKYTIYLLGTIIAYVLITILLSYITVNRSSENPVDNKTIYLSSNGVHLSIIIPKENLNSKVVNGLQHQYQSSYYMFGWGNEDFYLNTPTWNDFKFKYAFGALFLDTPTAIHVTTFNYKQPKWITIKCNQKELDNLNNYIFNSFKLNSDGERQIIPQNLYSSSDSFYKATGSYSVVKTCNTWVNDAFKQSGLKASYFTLFDFGLLQKYE